MKFNPARVLLLLYMVLGTSEAIAGAQVIREERFNYTQIATLAKGLERVLAEKRVRVAIISRVGLVENLLPEGVNYSHSGFAVYSKIRTADGRLVPGYAVYNLYQGEKRDGRSYLAQDYPVDYFSVAQRLDTGIVIPNEKLQSALSRTITSQEYTSLHNPIYSVISNPYNAEFQNCTEFVVDVIFSSIYRTFDRQRIKKNVSTFYKPQPVKFDGLKLAFAESTMPDVTTQDHDGPLAIATFSSIARFLLDNGIATEAFKFTVDPTTLYGTTAPLHL